MQQFVFADPGRRPHRHDPGLALGQGAGLVDDQCVDLFEPLERLRVLDQDARSRAPPDADHDRHRRREAERARAGDDQDRHRSDKAIGHARLRTPDRPGDERDDGGRNDQRHEPAGDLIGEPLDGRAAALGLRHHLHDLRQHRVAANLVGAHHEGAALVHRAADHPVARALADRHGLPGQHGFIDRAPPLDDLAVHRDLLARPDAQPVADLHRIECDLLVRAVRADEPRSLGLEIEQRADRAAGLLARPEFEHLSEQDKGRDDRRRFEIDRDGAVGGAERGREQARRNGRHDAIGPRHAHPHRDQREHVEIAGLERRKSPFKKRPARPERDRCRQRKLDPVGQSFRKEPMQIDQMPAHRECEDRNGERQRDPKAPGHVGQLLARAGRFRGRFRLERHAADRAASGVVLPDLRMHRAGVDRAGRRGLRRGRGACVMRMSVRMGRRRVGRLREKPHRVGHELFPAAARAEIIDRARVLGLVFGRRRIDRHAADGVLGERAGVGHARRRMMLVLHDGKA